MIWVLHPLLSADPATFDPWAFLAQLGAGAGVAAIAFFYSLRFSKTISEKDAEIARLNQAMLERERELNDRIIPQIVSFGDSMLKVPAKVAQASDARLPELIAELERLIRERGA